MRRRIGIAFGLAILAALVAAPSAAAAPSENASCVAQFVDPRTGPGEEPLGHEVRTFPTIFHPLGQTVSLQARSPRDACPFQ